MSGEPVNYNQAILDTSAGYLGLKEYPGAKSNPRVEELFAKAGFPGLTDDVPWCAGFVGAVLADVGLVPSGSLMARSYTNWGKKVAIQDALPGDVVVFARGAPPAGHVAFFLEFRNGRVVVRGGNQSNQVCDEEYPASIIVAVRRADKAQPSGRATIQMGDRGAMVLDLQTQLQVVGYFSGKKDGIFGKLTRASVLAFQADNDLDVDGVVGDRTWAALKKAKPKERRDVDLDDLRKRGSETVKAGDTLDIVAGTAGLATVAPAVKEAVETTNGIVPIMDNLLREHWPALLVLVLLAAAVLLSRRIKLARLEAAQIGADVSK